MNLSIILWALQGLLPRAALVEDSFETTKEAYKRF